MLAISRLLDPVDAGAVPAVDPNAEKCLSDLPQLMYRNYAEILEKRKELTESDRKCIKSMTGKNQVFDPEIWGNMDKFKGAAGAPMLARFFVTDGGKVMEKQPVAAKIGIVFSWLYAIEQKNPIWMEGLEKFLVPTFTPAAQQWLKKVHELFDKDKRWISTKTTIEWLEDLNKVKESGQPLSTDTVFNAALIHWLETEFPQVIEKLNKEIKGHKDRATAYNEDQKSGLHQQQDAARRSQFETIRKQNQDLDKLIAERRGKPHEIKPHHN